MPKCKLWFLDGKDSKGKTVSNPSVGYGSQTIKYANGTIREFYQIGMSAYTTGISVYVKARVSGYCIKFRTLEDIQLPVLLAAIRSAAKMASAICL